MLERVPWIVLAAFRRFGKHETMSNECRVCSTLARVALMARTSVHDPSARKPTPLAARFLPTISARIVVEWVWGFGGMKFFSQNCSFFLHRVFARVSPVFARAAILAAALALVLVPISLSASESSAEPSATVKRQTAEAQFTRAEEQRAALTAKPAEKRTLAEYRNVIASYKKVYWITPHAADVQDSLLAIGELYTEMGDRFGRVYYQSAVEAYQF